MQQILEILAKVIYMDNLGRHLNTLVNKVPWNPLEMELPRRHDMF